VGVVQRNAAAHGTKRNETNGHFGRQGGGWGARTTVQKKIWGSWISKEKEERKSV